jgi:O-antigen ligase
MTKSRSIDLLLMSAYALPYTLFLGISAQAIGLYVFGGLLPAIAAAKMKITLPRRHLRIVGLALFIVWMTFPLANLLNIVFDSQLNWEWKVIFKSNCPSSVAVFGGLFFILSYLRFSYGPEVRILSAKQLWTSHAFRTLLYHWKIAGLVFLSFIVLQLFTGINFRGNVEDVDQHLMFGSVYRVWGFYGHQLSLASVCLAHGIFFAWLLRQTYQNAEIKIIDATILAPIKKDLASIGLINAFILAATGGRTATIIFAVTVCLIFISKELLQRFSWALISMVIACAVFIYLRFKPFLDDPKHFEMKFQRISFWRVHWRIFLDHPWIGRGFGVLQAGERVEYYNRLGYENLKDKFNAHNFYLEALTNLGVIFTIVSVAALYRAAKEMWVFCKKYQATIIGQGFALSLVMNALHGFTQNTFFDSHVVFGYWYLFIPFFWLIVFSPFVEQQ